MTIETRCHGNTNVLSLILIVIICICCSQQTEVKRRLSQNKNKTKNTLYVAKVLFSTTIMYNYISKQRYSHEFFCGSIETCAFINSKNIFTIENQFKNQKIEDTTWHGQTFARPKNSVESFYMTKNRLILPCNLLQNCENTILHYISHLITQSNTNLIFILKLTAMNAKLTAVNVKNFLHLHFLVFSKYEQVTPFSISDILCSLGFTVQHAYRLLLLPYL